MKRKPKRKLFIFLTILCFTMVVVTLFIGFGVPNMRKASYNDENSILYEATFKSIEEENDKYYIYIYESDYRLSVDKNAVIDTDILNSLIIGENISFRSLFKINDDTPQQYKNLPIIALKTSEEDIVTFESSLAAEAPSEKKIVITTIVFACLFLFGAVLSILRLTGVISPKRGKNE